MRRWKWNWGQHAKRQKNKGRENAVEVKQDSSRWKDEGDQAYWMVWALSRWHQSCKFDQVDVRDKVKSATKLALGGKFR